MMCNYGVDFVDVRLFDDLDGKVQGNSNAFDMRAGISQYKPRIIPLFLQFKRAILSTMFRISLIVQSMANISSNWQ